MDGGVGVDYLKVFPHIHTEDLVVDGLIVPVSQVIVSRGGKSKHKSAQCSTCTYCKESLVTRR